MVETTPPTYLCCKLATLERLILVDWLDVGGPYPEEVRQQLEVLHEIENEVKGRNL